MAVGIFDSGIGGLSVYMKLKEKFPHTKFVYFADLVNFPYGTKIKDDITEYSRKITEFLISENVDTIIVACNTASANALDILKKEYDMKFLGMIDPICETLNIYEDKTLSLIATNMTVNSNVYQEKLGNKLKYIVAAPKLVEYAEKINKFGIDEIIEEYISQEMSYTNIILGCTHFPLVEKYIRKVYPEIILLDPSEYLANSIELNEDEEYDSDVFYTTGQLEYFKIQVVNVLRKENVDVRVHKWTNEF